MSLSRRRVLALLTLTTILLITIDVRGSSPINSVRSAFGTVMQPLQAAGRAVAHPIERAWRGATRYGDLEQENERLREQIDAQEGDHIAAVVAIQEYKDLQANVNLSTEVSRVVAQVQQYSAQNFQQTVEINRGTADGVRPGMAVASSAGLVGRITRASEHRAIVMLLTDQQFTVAVKVLGDVPVPGTNEDPNATSTTTTTPPPGAGSTAPLTSDPGFGDLSSLPFGADGTATGAETTTTAPPTTLVPETTTTLAPADRPVRELGALEGNGAGKPPVIGLLSSDIRAQGIKVGDVVATSGGCPSLAPPDITIGTVSKVSQRPGSAGPTVEVAPAADLTQLNFVIVLLYLPATEVSGETCG